MDKIKKIKELQELLDSGMINKSEFDKLKSEIIDGKEIAQSSTSIERENPIKKVNQKSRAERIKNRPRPNANRPNIPPKKKKKKSKKWMLWLFIPLFLFLVLAVVTLVMLESQSSNNQWEYYEEYEYYTEPEENDYEEVSQAVRWHCKYCNDIITMTNGRQPPYEGCVMHEGPWSGKLKESDEYYHSWSKID